MDDELRQALADAIELAGRAMFYVRNKHLSYQSMCNEYDRLRAILAACQPAPAMVDSDSSMEG